MSETEFLCIWRGGGGRGGDLKIFSPETGETKRNAIVEARVYRHLEQTSPMFTYMNLRSTNVLAITIHIMERIKTAIKSKLGPNYKNEVIFHFLLSYIKS